MEVTCSAQPRDWMVDFLGKVQKNRITIRNIKEPRLCTVILALCKKTKKTPKLLHKQQFFVLFFANYLDEKRKKDRVWCVKEGIENFPVSRDRDLFSPAAKTTHSRHVVTGCRLSCCICCCLG